jgi:hypothetical protein
MHEWKFMLMTDADDATGFTIPLRLQNLEAKEEGRRTF